MRRPTQIVRAHNRGNTTVKSDSLILTDASGIWNRIRKSGLAPTTYDKAFAEAFSRALGLRTSKGIAGELRRLRPTVNAVLTAFISCCEPFDGMAQDVWTMFVRADARFSDDNLRIAFDFSKQQPSGIKFDLEHFKAFHEELVRFKQLVRSYSLTPDFLWGLAEVRHIGDRGPASPNAERWAAAYEQGRWITPIPQVPSTSNPRGDLCLRETRSVVATVVELLASSGVRPHEGPHGYRQRTGTRLDETTEDDSLFQAARADHDRWTRSMVIGLDALRMAVSRGDEDALATIGELERHLKNHRHSVEEETLGSRLQEFLNLPLWKFRHQLFGLWTASQIADAVGYERMVFHPVNGALRFRFTDTHIATVSGEPRLHLYAELRTSASRVIGKGRVRGIQPDWRLVGEPITDQSSQVVIVECKQYAKAKRRNFLETVIDYAVNSGKAEVILVNYGEMNEARLHADLPAHVADRVTLIGGFRPSEIEARSRFREQVVSRIPAKAAERSALQPAGLDQAVRFAFSLSWDGPGVDLDLHLLLPAAEGLPPRVFFGARGAIDAPPWAHLQEDVRQGDGAPEVLRLTRLVGGRYELWVNKYTEGDRFPQMTVLRADLGNQTIRLQPPHTAGRAWHVLDFDGGSGVATIVNAIHPLLPFA